MKRFKRHPAEVTADRLKDDVERWFDKFDGADRDDISHVIFLLEEIAAGNR